jgi:hypothetical protein
VATGLEFVKSRIGRNSQRHFTGQTIISRTQLGIAVAVAGVIVWIAFELGQIRAGHNSIEARARYSELDAILDEEQGKSQRLRERIAQLEADVTIDAQGYRRVEKDLVELQTEILTQQEDLEFYRGIVSDQQAGLRVQDLVLWPSADPFSFSMRLVLAQAIRANRKISGSVELQVEGSRDGAPVSLSLKDLGTGAQRPDRLNFSFRYFQNLETVLKLPEGFAPSRVTVRLTTKGKKAKPVERTFDWPERSG